MHFPTTRDEIEQRIDAIDVIAYARNRNFLNGSVTHLSPYITHGYISLPSLRDRVLQKFTKKEAYTFIFELAWREFFQRTWQKEGDAIFYSLKQPQVNVFHKTGLPKSYIDKKTKIEAIDKALNDLEDIGYVHNHARLWMASLITGIGKTAWQEGARHMYYHLLDGDRASNTLSWQWVAGTFSSKQYIANQDMINKYAMSKQYGTYLDTAVESLASVDTPQILVEHETYNLALDDTLLQEESISRDTIEVKETWLYSMWALDPVWKPTVSKDIQKILFIDKDDLLRYPMSVKRLAFILALSKNIEGMRVYYGSLSDLKDALQGSTVYKKHHVTMLTWPGTMSNPEYLFPQVTTIPGGFMSFWKKCEPYL